MFKKLLRDEEGATMTEYILLVVLLAVALIAIVRFFGENIAKLFRSSGEAVGDTEGTSYDGSSVSPP
jgi:Flp pilus assembly pilin Flp